MSSCLILKVTPQSGKQAFIKDKSGIIKCYLKSPAEGGKANEELIKLLSKRLNIPQNLFVITQGLKSRKKTVHIKASIDSATLNVKLGLETQLQL